MAKKVLITGARGFIGTHLSRALREKNFDVYTLSPGGSGPNHFSADILSFNRYNEYDVIYHLAAISNPRVCEADPEKAWVVNVEGTRHIVTQLTEKQYIVYPSTPHVHGFHNGGDIYETAPLNPSNIYGITKMFGEELVRVFSKKQGFRYTTIRIFHAYGPGQKEGQLVPDVIKKIATQEEVVLRGSHNFISPVYVDDVIDVLTDTTVPPGTYNVCGTCVSVEEVYRTIADSLRKSNLVADTGGPINETRMCGNRGKIVLFKKKWISLAEGISRTVTASGY